MIDAPLALGFTAGVLAAFNPCGFAMLPAYLGFFAGVDEQSGLPASSTRAVARALRASLVVSLGFSMVFAAAGLLVVQASVAVSRFVPWLTIAIGIALVVFGFALLRGALIKIRFPLLQKGGRDRGTASMLLFGLSYGTVSLTCTLAPFVAAVSTTFVRAGFASGMAVLLAYAAGMSSVVVVLTVALALAKGRLVGRMRNALRYVNRVAGALLVVTGAYVAWYGWYDLGITQGRDVAAGPVQWVSAASAWASNTVNRLGAIRVAAVAVAVVAALVALPHAARSRRRLSRAGAAGVSSRR